MIHSATSSLVPSFDIHGGPSGSTEDAKVRVDFSVSLNAFGPAECVVSAIRSAQIDTYPDPTSFAVRHSASEYWQRPLEEFSFGAGTSELLYALSRALLSKGDRTLIVTPTFGEYERCAKIAGAQIHRVEWSLDADTLDADVVCNAITRIRPTVVFVCTPNNPTGRIISRDNLTRFAESCARINAILVIDQSYDAFSSSPLGTPALPGHPSVLHLRSITKDHALAGIRAGFLIGPPSIIHAIELQRAPWSASTVAQAAAVAALSPTGGAHLAYTIPQLRNEQQRIHLDCERIGLKTLVGDTHTLLIRVGDSSIVRSVLLERYGIRVRDCTSFGLPDMIRIAARTPLENDLLITALPSIHEIVSNISL